jgi:hypothetical protein
VTEHNDTASSEDEDEATQLFNLANSILRECKDAAPLSDLNTAIYPFSEALNGRPAPGDVPGRAWAQALGSGWASEGLGLRNLKPHPELRAGLGLGLVGLKPRLSSQNGNASIVG